MTSNPPARCCSLGTLHEGDPTGERIKIDGQIDAYLAQPTERSSNTLGILYLGDILGIWQNSMLMVDTFASKGYTCLAPDLFNGDPAPFNMPDDFDVMGWLTEGSDGNNPHVPETIDPVIIKGIEYLKSLGVRSIGAVGYCFGAKYAIRHYRDGIDCGFIAHPSFVESDELAAITGPLSIAAAETDGLFPVQKRHESEDILKKTKQPFQISLYSGVEHGFAVRGDPKVKAQRIAKQMAFEQALSWFGHYLEHS